MRTRVKKCRFCGNDTIIKPNSFVYRGVGYDLPYCKDCNSIFEEDVDKIINAIRSLECQSSTKST